MATYTMRLNEAMEAIFSESMDSDDYEIEYDSFTFNGVTYGRLPKIPDATLMGLGTYPIFDESYRPILNGKIVDQYFNREIGMETIDDWKLVLRRKMDQIMPFYNKLYESERIIFDPMRTMDILSKSSGQVETAEEVASTGENITNTKAKARAVSSETPQTALSGNADYATSASDSNSDSDVAGNSSQESNSSSNTQNESENHVTGYQGIASELIIRYRNSLLNIDTMILSDIEDCFMLVLNNGDAYTPQGWYY